eukprot:760294-Hanusia_phi.AAC.2
MERRSICHGGLAASLPPWGGQRGEVALAGAQRLLLVGLAGLRPGFAASRQLLLQHVKHFVRQPTRAEREAPEQRRTRRGARRNGDLSSLKHAPLNALRAQGAFVALRGPVARLLSSGSPRAAAFALDEDARRGLRAREEAALRLEGAEEPAV